MKIEEIKEFGVYSYYEDNGQAEFVEVQKVYKEERMVKVSLYKSGVLNMKIVSTTDILPVSITEPILKALTFEEIFGQLYGLPNEHYYRLQMDNGIIEIIKDEGVMKYVQPSMDRENWYGCRFVPMPYLHKLQDILGRIDLKDFSKKLFKDNNYATPTT